MSLFLPAATQQLPVSGILQELTDTLARTTCCVLQAPPGAGKTTAVPLALLHAQLPAGRIVMLEPRRLAARSAARRMAQMLGQRTGETVGFRVRHHSCTGSGTRIEVVTEGVLTRMIQSDPALTDVACVIFDEFHERSLQGDLGLTLCLEVQAALRPELRLIVMSATLDGAPVAALMGGCPVLTATGRSHAVHTRHIAPPAGRSMLDRHHCIQLIADGIRRALYEEQGSILAFLPGLREITLVAEALQGAVSPDGCRVQVLPLHGRLTPQQQDAAICPAPQGVRKVVLSTSVAETSLTLEGIRIVVDSGLTRKAQFDPRSGMTGLVTRRASLAAAAQRQGRAGRLQEGICYRLWSKADEPAMPAFDRPEILEADLVPLALELARWGACDHNSLPWLTPPPHSSMEQAAMLLCQLGALKPAPSTGLRHITQHGARMAALPVHPRLAHMVITAADTGQPDILEQACRIAAVFSEAPSALRRQADLCTVIEDAATGRTTDSRTAARTAQMARRLAAAAGKGPDDRPAVQALRTLPADARCAALCALAFPDRIGKATGQGRFLLTCGRAAIVAATHPLAGSPFIVAAELDGQNADARIHAAAALDSRTVETLYADNIAQQDNIQWNPQTEAVEATTQRTLWKLPLEVRPLAEKPHTQAAVQAMCEGIRSMGLSALPWTRETETLRQRVMLLRRHEPCGADQINIWPDFSEETLLATLETWLAPFLDGIRRRTQLKNLNLKTALQAMLPWPLPARLEQEAPELLTVPSGSNIRLDYSGPVPVLAVKLQEMFGATATPAIGNGRIPVLVHLLSPAGRPLQITQDLEGFWKNGYRQVKAEMKGRYPKHPWPDDPVSARPTRRTNTGSKNVS
jgi:ATP-dependent helicase HrpB